MRPTWLKHKGIGDRAPTEFPHQPRVVRCLLGFRQIFLNVCLSQAWDAEREERPKLVGAVFLILVRKINDRSDFRLISKGIGVGENPLRTFQAQGAYFQGTKEQAE